MHPGGQQNEPVETDYSCPHHFVGRTVALSCDM